FGVPDCRFRRLDAPHELSYQCLVEAFQGRGLYSEVSAPERTDVIRRYDSHADPEDLIDAFSVYIRRSVAENKHAAVVPADFNNFYFRHDLLVFGNNLAAILPRHRLIE